MNNVILIGRISKEVEVEEVNGGKKVSNITMAVPRSYKNQDGIYETDFINVTIWNSLAELTRDCCKKGDLISIKGRLHMNSYEKENGKKEFKLNVVAEKINFLSQSKENYEFER